MGYLIEKKQVICFLLSTTYLQFSFLELQNENLKESNEKNDHLTSELEDCKVSLQRSAVWFKNWLACDESHTYSSTNKYLWNDNSMYEDPDLQIEKIQSLSQNAYSLIRDVSWKHFKI